MSPQSASNNTVYRKRRVLVFVGSVLVLAATLMYNGFFRTQDNVQLLNSVTEIKGEQSSVLAVNALGNLPVKGRAPKNAYIRSLFGEGWQSISGCDTRNRILARDLINITYRDETCVVQSGTLTDPYTGKQIIFQRGEQTSSLVQIDHVVALSDAWQKGAQSLSEEERVMFANDELNLLAVDGEANEQKSDSDAASWLPPNKSYRCRYIARQVAVKVKYKLWVTAAERDAMLRALGGCPGQVLPIAGGLSQ